MSLPSGRAFAIVKSRLIIVSNNIRPKNQSIRLNSFQQNYATATWISSSTNKEGEIKCYLFKESLPKDIKNQFLDCNTTQLQRTMLSANISKNLTNLAQIYSNRSFSLQSRPPFSTKPPPAKQPPPTHINVKPSKAEQLKQAFKEYGPTIMGFHLIISVTSLGGVYALVSGGIDLQPILEFLGISSSAVADKVTTGSTFVVALAIYKILAPIRISITLGFTPLVVRYLRSKGLMKAKTKAL